MFRPFVSIVVALALSAPFASADMFKPSKKDQLDLGKRAAAELKKKEKVLPDSDPRVKLIRKIGSKLIETIANDKNKWDYSFDVIQGKVVDQKQKDGTVKKVEEVNAFALPGGPVFFYTGLLKEMKTEDQIAAVLAHELTHVRKEHWAYAYADNSKRKLGLTILLSLGRANNNLFNLADVTDDLLFSLPYSRKHENEADALGCDMMVNAGFNPQGMVDTFEILRKASEGKKPPEFLSDHPDDAGRIKRIQDRIAKIGPRTYPEQKKLNLPKE